MATKIHAPTAEERMVEDQYGTRGEADKNWEDDQAGQDEIDAAKKDGRWAAAYDSPSKSKIPEDFLAALRQDKKAKSFFDALNKANLYAIAYQLQTAKKPETRQRRMEMILTMLARNESFH